MNEADLFVRRAIKNIYSVDSCIEFLDLYPEILDTETEKVEKLYTTWFVYDVGFRFGQKEATDNFWNLFKIKKLKGKK